MSKYHKGDKFIVEIKEVMNSDKGTLYRSEFSTLTFDDYGLDKLQKYEEEVIATKFYEKGRKEALQEVQNCESYGYEQGLSDAWELAKKLWRNEPKENYDTYGYEYYIDIASNLTPQEALAKLEAYEKEQEEVKVGDVVESIIGEIEYLIITEEDDDDYEFGAINLHAMQVDRITNKGNSFKKTGKHIDLEDLFKQIGGGE